MQPAIFSVSIVGPYLQPGACSSGQSEARSEPRVSGEVGAGAKLRACEALAASAADEDGCAQEILKNLMRRAYRRPVTEDDENLRQSLRRETEMVPSMTAWAKTAAKPVRRLGFVYVPMGSDITRWTPPGTSGALGELSPSLSPLAALKVQINVVTNLELKNAYPGTHATSNASFLSAAKAKAQSEEGALPDVDRPVGVPAAYADHARLMFDLQVLALQSDVTRVVTFQLARESSNRTYPEIGVPDPHHPTSHHGNDPEKVAKLAKINQFHVSLFAYFLEQLASVPEGDGTLRDNSVYLYGSGMGNPNVHDHVNLPIIVAGAGSNCPSLGTPAFWPAFWSLPLRQPPSPQPTPPPSPTPRPPTATASTRCPWPAPTAMPRSPPRSWRPAPSRTPCCPAARPCS